MRGRDLGARQAFSGGRGLPVRSAGLYGQDAVAVLDNLARLFHVRDAEAEFAPGKVEQDTLGFHNVRLKQMHQGLPVVGGDLIVHFNGGDVPYQVNGTYVPDLEAKAVPGIDAREAVRIARKDLTGMGSPAGNLTEGPDLVVYARNATPQLAYQLVLAYDRSATGAGRWRYWINAADSSIVARFNDIQKIDPPSSSGSDTTIQGAILPGEGGVTTNVTGWHENTDVYYLYNTNRHWYIYNVATADYPDSNTYAYRTTNDWSATDPSEMSGAINFDSTQEYFLNVHNRQSFNDANIYARANVHQGTSYVNAYWDGTDFHFGDGDGVAANALVVMDVSGHEFTHAVTEYTAGLIYSYESGALNESFSDIFGACVEFYAQPDGRVHYPGRVAGTADWLCGEDCWLSSTALRDLRNPANPITVGAGNEQPTRYLGTFWYDGPNDSGGVHQNSGVQNFFFYLLCEGGSGNNDGIPYNVTGLGIVSAERIAYRALTVYCTPGADHRAARNAWLSAALDLNAIWADSVDAAWTAVGVGPVSVTPESGVVFSGDPGGPFSPASHVFTLSNEGTIALVWAATHTENWCDVVPAAGSIGVGQTSNVTVTLNVNAEAMGEGAYGDTLSFSNSASAMVETRDVTLRIGQPDYFTEQFEASDNDLDNLMLTLTADGSASTYSACVTPITEFPTDPTGSTSLALTDDSYAEVVLTSGAQVNLYGVAYDRLYVGSNGYITFGSGDADYTESLADHFDLPRLSGLFDDLYPPSGGTVSWTQLVDRVVVTFEDISEFSASNLNNFQFELFFDGTIRIAYLNVDAADGLAGISEGAGIPADFVESDLSAYGLCPPPDDLQLAPNQHLDSLGYEGGPFFPSNLVYTLSNTGTNGLSWTSIHAEPWVSVTPGSGALGVGGSTNVTVAINANANLLPTNLYADTMIFSNVTSGFTHERRVELEVQPVPGKISVTDTIAPTGDLDMPFGQVIVGLSRTEQLTVSNTDSTYDLIVSSVSLRGGSVTPAAPLGTPISVFLPAVAPIAANPLAYASKGSPGRPASVLEVQAGPVLASGMDVLLLASGADPTGLRTGLAAYPDISIVDYFDCSTATPTEALLAGYDAVVILSDAEFATSAGTGNILADFVDAGGAVVQAVATFATGGGWELAGRFVTEGYGPFVHGGPDFFTHTLGAFLAGHPIMSGVSTLTDGLTAAVALKPGAEWVADWNTGAPLVAVAESGVVGINIFAMDGGNYAGDVALLFRNALVYASASGFALENAPALPWTIPAGSNVTFDVIFAPESVGSNTAVVVIESTDADEPTVQVTLNGEGIADYLGVTPATAFEASGHPGGPFSPSNTTYELCNTGPVTIDWSASHTQAWVGVTPTGGTLDTGACVTVTVSLDADALPEGVYTDRIAFINETTALTLSRNVTLTVYTSPQIVITPTSLVVTAKLGQVTQRLLNIANAPAADGNLDFTLKVRGVDRSVPLHAGAGMTRPPEGHDFTKVEGNTEHVPGELLVRFAAGMPGGQRATTLDAAGGGQVAREYHVVPGLALVKLPTTLSVAEALLTYNNTRGILYAEPNYIRKLIETIPSDSRFSELWGMHNTGQTGGAPDADIDAPEAWEIATGSRAIIVAVTDTGVDYNHVDLRANIWSNSAEVANGIDDDGNGYVDDIYGYDFVNDDSDPMDDHSHGSHCSGTIGGVGDNGIGVAGVCWQTRIMAAKCFDASGSGPDSAILSAIEYSTMMGCNVMSASWGGGGYSQSTKDLIEAAGDQGIVFVAAAGNDYGNDNDSNPHYPSSYDLTNIIAVMSTDHNDVRSSFSNLGATSVDLGAPGSSIVSTVPGNAYGTKSGTSMATPHVSGACALLLSVNPTLSMTELKEALLSTVDPTLSGQCLSGGRMNVAAALDAAGLPWLNAEPTAVSGVTPGSSVNVTLKVDTTVLTDTGVYQRVIQIMHNDPGRAQSSVPLTLVVFPDDLTVTPDAAFVAKGVAGGPFGPAEMAYTLTNSSALPLRWSVSYSQAWLNVSPQGGTLAAEGLTNVSVSISGVATSLMQGVYADMLSFSNVTSQTLQTREVELSIYALPIEARITRIWMDGTNTVVEWSSTNSWYYALEWATNLLDGAAGWKGLGSGWVLATDGSMIGTDTNAHPVGTHFYRLRVKP